MRTTLTVQKQCFALVLPVILLFAAGIASADIACYECHGSKVPPDYRPVDAPYRNITTGGFQGNHRTHLSPADTFNGCVRCHPGSNAYTSSHRDGKIKVAANINNSPLGNARYRNNTSAWKQTATPLLGTCSNVNCHFEQTTPTWGADPLVYPAGCSVCHGAPPSGGLTGAAGSHGKHDQYYPGAANCQLCHGPSHTTFEHATSVGRPLVVKPRHSSDTLPGSYNGPVTDYLPSQGNSYGSCSTFYCHSNGTKVVTGQLNAFVSPIWGSVASCDACHGYPPDYPNGTPKANSHGYPHSQSCDTCHSATTADGYTITDQTKHVNGAYDIVPGAGLAFTYTFKTNGGTCTNVACHATRTGSRDWGARPDTDCNGCHESPPNTPSHLKHFSGTAGQAVYGSTSTAPDNATGYLFNCGNCHPINPAKHRNGTLEVELYNAGAPAGSIKAKPDNVNASYTRVGTKQYDSRGYPYYNGTCSNIYCHSYNTWTTPGGVAAYTSYSSYRPANLVETRKYKTVTWGGPSLSCTGCHENPPRSYASAGNDGGAGNSHSWIIDGSTGGEEFLHSINISQHGVNGNMPGLSCTTCHNDTVKNLNVISYNKIVYNNATSVFAQYSAVPIANYGKHVNGTADVAFDKSRQLVYPPSWYGQVIFNGLSSTYTPATKTCSNVACHFNEKSVVWGTPYRYYNPYECNRCHRR